MKKWEKPTIQNLALNHTHEEGIEPTWWWKEDLQCSSCGQIYEPNDWGDGYHVKGDSSIKALSNLATKDWRCNMKYEKPGLFNDICWGVLNPIQSNS